MAHTTSAPLNPTIRPGVLIALLLTGALGFALGQSWPVHGISADTSDIAVPEDWHGNVRRSYWTD